MGMESLCVVVCTGGWKGSSRKGLGFRKGYFYVVTQWETRNIPGLGLPTGFALAESKFCLWGNGDSSTEGFSCSSQALRDGVGAARKVGELVV